MTRIALLAAAAVACGLLVAGCGDSSSSSSSTTTEAGAANATQAWTQSVCTAFTTWRGSLQKARESLGARGNVSRNSLTTALDSVRSANETLKQSVQGLTRPPTLSGEQATQTLDTLRDQLESGAKQIQSMLVSTNTEQPLATVSRVTGTLATMRVQVQTAISDIRKLDVEGELNAALKQSPACQPFLEK